MCSSDLGFAIGFDRTILAMDELKLFPAITTKTKVLVTVFNSQLLKTSQVITQKLRQNQINTDIYPDPQVKLAKQLKYANDNQIPYVLVIGEEEIKKNQITLKNMTSGKQKTLTLEKAINVLTR